MKIYIGSLGYTTTEEDIKKVVEKKFGKVKSVQLVKDKDTGQSKGYGFIEMERKKDAMKVIEKMNGEIINGTHVKVSVARKSY